MSLFIGRRQHVQQRRTRGRHGAGHRPLTELLEDRTLLSTWYVSNSGSDAAAGSLAAPFQSLRHAVVDAALAGDTVLLRGGTYAGVFIEKPNLTIASYQGEHAIVASPTDDANIEVTIRLGEDASNTRLENLEVVGGYYYAIKTETTWGTGASNPHGPSNVLISGCDVHGAGSDVIKLTPATNYTTIENSEIYDSGLRVADNAEGIDAVQANYATVRGCYIHDTANNGVVFKGGSVSTLIENNRIARAGYSGILLGQQTDEVYFDTSVDPGYYENLDGVVRNNIVWDTQGAGVGAWAALRPQVYNNTLWNVAQTMFGGLLIQGQQHYVRKSKMIPSQDVTMYNNIVMANASRPALEIRTGALAGTLTLSNNNYYQPSTGVYIRDLTRNFYGSLTQWKALGFDANSLEADPRLNTASDYQLLSTSPAIDAGKTAPISTDIDFNPRPAGAAYDIGAHEFQPVTVATTTTLAASVNPAVFGQSVLYTATVAAATGPAIPVGTVSFRDGTSVIGTAALDASGAARFTTAALAAGSHSITAVYGGNAAFTGSTSAGITQTVNPASTATTVQTPPSAVVGQSVQFTATVTSVAPGSGTPTGLVQFLLDGANLGGPVALSSGTATSPLTAPLTLGGHLVSASYAGSSNYAISTAANVTQTVNPAATTTSLRSSANPAASGQSVTFTATVVVVAPGSGTPAGTVSFRDAATLLGTVALDGSGQAAFTTAALSTGSHAITALYSGGANFSGSTSAALTQTVGLTNDNFANRTVISGSSITTTGSNAGASKESGEPNIAGNAGGKSVWWTWTAPTSGSVTIDTIGSSFDTLLGVYTGTAVSSLTLVKADDDGGGNLTSKVTFTATAGQSYQIAVDGYRATSGSITLHVNLATAAPSAPTGVLASDGTYPDKVHVTWNASPGATSYEVWRGTSNNSGNATKISVSDVSTPQFDDSTASSGVTYWYWVKAKNSGGTSGFSGSDSGYRSPANNNFADRTALVGTSLTAAGGNVGATRETGEPNILGNAGGKSVWWTWTAPASGSVTIDTVGSSFDTLLGVYTGGSVSSLALVKADDDSGGNYTSRVTFTATAGQTYQIAVDGYGGTSGSIALHLKLT